MELREPADQRREHLPVVTHSVRRRMESGQPDCWDYATLLELAVLEGDGDKIMNVIPETVAAVRETWEPKDHPSDAAAPTPGSREARGDPSLDG